MLSVLITPTCRLTTPLSISDEELAGLGLKRKAIEIIEFRGDCWCNNNKLLAQTIDAATSLFELRYLSCQAIFPFDIAPNYKDYPVDALKANVMDLAPGGEAPVMRNG